MTPKGRAGRVCRAALQHSWRATGGATRARARTILFLGVLTALLLATPFMPPPQGPTAFVITALAGYAGLAAYAAWVDRGRAAAFKNPR